MHFEPHPHCKGSAMLLKTLKPPISTCTHNALDSFTATDVVAKNRNAEKWSTEFNLVHECVAKSGNLAKSSVQLISCFSCNDRGHLTFSPAHLQKTAQTLWSRNQPCGCALHLLNKQTDNNDQLSFQVVPSVGNGCGGKQGTEILQDWKSTISKACIMHPLSNDNLAMAQLPSQWMSALEPPRPSENRTFLNGVAEGHRKTSKSFDATVDCFMPSLGLAAVSFVGHRNSTVKCPNVLLLTAMAAVGFDSLSPSSNRWTNLWQKILTSGQQPQKQVHFPKQSNLF